MPGATPYVSGTPVWSSKNFHIVFFSRNFFTTFSKSADRFFFSAVHRAIPTGVLVLRSSASHNFKNMFPGVFIEIPLGVLPEVLPKIPAAITFGVNKLLNTLIRIPKRNHLRDWINFRKELHIEISKPVQWNLWNKILCISMLGKTLVVHLCRPTREGADYLKF